MFMETLMGNEIFKGSEKRSEEEMRQEAYDSGEILIPFLTKKFPNPDQAISAVISIIAQIALLQQDKMKRLILLNNVQSAVLGMVDLYEKGELDESQEEDSEVEVEEEDFSSDPDQDDEEEGEEEEQGEEDGGEDGDDGDDDEEEQGDDEEEEEVEVEVKRVKKGKRRRAQKVAQKDDSLKLAGYHSPEEGDE